MLDAMRGLFTRKRQITSLSYKSLQSNSVYSNQKLCEGFAYTPTPLVETLGRVAKHINS
jgi:hypothetical protein